MRIFPNRTSLLLCRRSFSTSQARPTLRELAELPDRIAPFYPQSRHNDLLALKWPSPSRNILLLSKDRSQAATDALLEFAHHIATSYPSISLIVEPAFTAALQARLPESICATTAGPASYAIPNLYKDLSLLHSKTDLIATFGGDGTILRASSLFSTTTCVPPILSFAMGTLGFLGEWKFKDYKSAFREVYMSGAPSVQPSSPALGGDSDDTGHESGTAWHQVRGKTLGESRGAKVLLRHRLKVGIHPSGGLSASEASPAGSVHHAMNEVLLHRGLHPHLIHILIHINGRFLTEAVADGMLISTPTGSTAYSLSAGGSIIHPLVPSLLLTPICPRSLSFRPLVLPATSEVTLTLSDKNRGKEVEVSVDGMRRPEGVGVGCQVKVTGEQVLGKPCNGNGREASAWTGGVPCIMKASEKGGDDGWVGGLTNLLKFNYPFGEEE